MLELLPKWLVVCSAIGATGIAIKTLRDWYKGVTTFYTEKKDSVHRKYRAIMFWTNEVNKPFFMIAEGAWAHAHRQHLSGLLTWIFICAMFFLWLVDWWVDWRNQQMKEIEKVVSSLTIMTDRIPATRLKFEELMLELGRQIQPASPGSPVDTVAADTTTLAVVANVEHQFASSHFLALIHGILMAFMVKSRKRTLQLINSVLWFSVGLYLMFA